MSNRDDIIEAWAAQLRLQVVDAAIDGLMEMGGDALQSGDDSPLESIWEEICVQVQGEQSALWDLYEDIVKDQIEFELRKLSLEARSALWLQTEAGWHWAATCRMENAMARVPTDDSDVITALIASVYERAADYESENIDEYKWGNGE